MLSLEEKHDIILKCRDEAQRELSKVAADLVRRYPEFRQMEAIAEILDGVRAGVLQLALANKRKERGETKEIKELELLKEAEVTIVSDNAKMYKKGN